MGVGLLGQVESGQDLRSGLTPRLPTEQLGARIGPSLGTDGEDIPAAKSPVQLFEHAERVGAMVDHPRLQIGVLEHQPAPDAGHQLA